MASKKYFLLLLCLLVGVISYCQDERQRLVDVLKIIQEQYDITFTYNDESIAGIMANTPPRSLTKLEVIEYLQQNTGLIFEVVSEKFVGIRKPSEKVNICGTVKDIESQLPIIGATIQIGEKFDVTDDSGQFQVNGVKANDMVIFRSLGYNSISREAYKLASEPCQSVSLRVLPVTLKEVIVTNLIARGINKDVEGSLIIDVQNLGILPGLIEPDVLKTLQALPGIQSINETVSNINIRGGTNDQNLILWDGIKMYQTGHFFGLISAYNPYLTDKVVLTKNGSSAYLGDGISGTINIESDDELVTKVSGGGGLNLINSDFYLKLPISKRLTAQISSRRSFADFLQTPTYDQYFDRAFRDTDVLEDQTQGGVDRITADENFNFFDVSARLLYDISPNDALRVNFLNISNDVSYEETAEIGGEANTRTSGLEQGSLASGISYQRIWNNQLKTSAQAYYSRYALDAVNFDIFNDQRLIQENEVIDTGLKLDARYLINPRAEIFAGYQFFEIGVTNLEDINDPRFRRLVKRVIRSHSLFGEALLSSRSGKTSLRAGLRANYFSKFDHLLVEPRLAFSHQFLDHFTWEVLGEFKNQSSSQVIDFQNDFLGIEQRRWILSNDTDLPIIQSKQLSTGLSFQKNNLLVSAEGYVKNVDGITSSSQGFQNQFQFIRSSGSYDIFGLDLLINKQVGNLSVWTSYSFTDNTYTFSEFTPSEFPNNFEITHTVNSGAAYITDRFEVALGFNWNSGRPFTTANGVSGNNIVFDSPNNAHLTNYMRIDFSSKYHFKLTKVMNGELGFSIWNLSNRDNIVNAFYRVEDDQPVLIEQEALGITPNLSFRVSF